MKKTLLSLALITLGFAASAQCTPDPSVNSGISPDTTTNLSVAYTGQPYSEIFTFVVPLDTIDPGTGANVTIAYIQLDNVVGIPSNFSFTCNPSNCQFPGGTSGCVDLYSTSDPTVAQVGSYPLTIEATGYIVNVISPFLPPISVGQTIYNGYYLVIAEQTPVSVEQVGNNQMKSLIAYPNPTNGNTTIEFAMGYNSEVTFTVTNLLGAIVNVQNLSTTKGLNRIQFDASNVPNGVYFYTITDGKNTISKKLIVSK